MEPLGPCGIYSTVQVGSRSRYTAGGVSVAQFAASALFFNLHLRFMPKPHWRMSHEAECHDSLAGVFHPGRAVPGAGPATPANADADVCRRMECHEGREP